MSSSESKTPGSPAPRHGARGVLLFVLGGLSGGALAANATRTARHAEAAPAPLVAGMTETDGPATGGQPTGLEQGSASRAARLGEDGRPRDASPRRFDQPLGFIAVGGGADPTSTQVQLEQDVALFAETVSALSGEAGATLFAGGADVRAVQVLDEQPSTSADDLSDLRAALGELLDPRPERMARYRVPAMLVHGRADADTVLALLSQQVALPGERLELFVASHGDAGESPAENYVALFGDSSFDARQLAAALAPAAAQRGARVVVTACYGGGFAELAFEGADVAEGPTLTDLCGLFATSAEHESNGCDANPDRQAQEGYALHLLHALRGQDRDGAPSAGIDLDHDGVVGLLEAHTRARIASHSIDLPSTTSERFLRSLGLVTTRERGSSSDASYATPEDDAVIRALGSVLGVTSEDATRATREALEAQLEESAASIEQRGTEEDEALHALWLELGVRWPELLDPFRADFEPTLRANRRDVAAFFRASAANAHAHARGATERALLAEEALRVRWVQLMRLERAFETRRLARALAESRPADEPARRHYEALLACERAPLRRSEPVPP